jgi:hypothetical protein
MSAKDEYKTMEPCCFVPINTYYEMCDEIDRLRTTIDKVRDTLTVLRQWDMLSLGPDGRGAVTSDAPWAIKLIDDTLFASRPQDGGAA